MHVLVIPSWYPATCSDVAGSFFREQALAIARSGCEVGVIAPQSISLRKPRLWSSGSRLASYEDDHGMPTFRQTSVEWFGRVPQLGISAWVRRGLHLFEDYVAKVGAPDVLHAHCLLNAGCLAREIHERTGIPYVVTEHSTAYARNLIPAWKMRQAVRAASAASARIAVSAPFAEVLRAALGREAGPWKVIPNIVDSRFTRGPLREKTTGGGSFRFANVGLLTEKKGQGVLLRAFAKAFAGDPAVTLAIGGDGPQRAELARLADSLGIAAQVSFLGNLSREQVRELLLESDAFVLTSHVETFGVVVIEALGMGLPVIASRSGGPESILSEADGVLVTVGDVAATANAMRDMVANVSRYSPEDLRSRCEARYSGAAIAGRLGVVFRDAVAGAREE